MRLLVCLAPKIIDHSQVPFLSLCPRSAAQCIIQEPLSAAHAQGKWNQFLFDIEVRAMAPVSEYTT